MNPARLTVAVLLLLLAPGAIQAQTPSDGDDLRSLRDRLASLQSRAQRGEIGLLSDPSGSGAPSWLVVDLDDVRGQLAALTLSGEFSRAEAARKAGDLRRDFATGLERLNRALADVESRIRAMEPPAPAALPSQAGPSPSETARRDPPVADAPGGSETWEVRLTGVGGTGEDRALSSLAGRLELSIGADGAVTGRIAYEGRTAADPSVSGTIRDRRALLRFDGPDGTGEALLTGAVDASGKHVNGRYQITSGSTVIVRGSWQATRQ